MSIEISHSSLTDRVEHGWGVSEFQLTRLFLCHGRTSSFWGSTVSVVWKFCFCFWVPSKNAKISSGLIAAVCRVLRLVSPVWILKLLFSYHVTARAWFHSVYPSRAMHPRGQILWSICHHDVEWPNNVARHHEMSLCMSALKVQPEIRDS